MIFVMQMFRKKFNMIKQQINLSKIWELPDVPPLELLTFRFLFFTVMEILINIFYDHILSIIIKTIISYLYIKSKCPE